MSRPDASNTATSPTTTVTIAGGSYPACSHYWDDNGRTRPNTWIKTGPDLRDLITERVTQAITEIRASRIEHGLYVRGVIDTALRVQRAIHTHFTTNRVIETEAGVRSYYDTDPVPLAAWVDKLIDRIPDIVRAEATHPG